MSNDTILEQEEVLWEGRPHIVNLVWRLIFSAILLVIVTPFVWFLQSIMFFLQSSYGLIITVVIYGVIALNILYQYLLYKSYEFKITNLNVIFKGGVLLKKVRKAPLQKITDVGRTQSIIQRLFGVFDVHIHTAGTGTPVPEVKFFSLENPDQLESTLNQIMVKYQNRNSR